jgi:hypothetical protein
MKKQRVGGGPDQPGDRPSKKVFFRDHPEKKNVEPQPRGAYPTGHLTTKCSEGATSVPPEAKKESESLVDRQVGGNSDPKKRGE